MTSNRIEEIKLIEPITIGTPKDDPIKKINLRRPTAGDLRGLSMTEIIGMQVDAHLKLLTRIGQPILTIDQLNAISPQDLLAIQGKIFGFFMPSGRTPMPIQEKA